MCIVIAEVRPVNTLREQIRVVEREVSLAYDAYLMNSNPALSLELLNNWNNAVAYLNMLREERLKIIRDRKQNPDCY